MRVSAALVGGTTHRGGARGSNSARLGDGQLMSQAALGAAKDERGRGPGLTYLDAPSLNLLAQVVQDQADRVEVLYPRHHLKRKYRTPRKYTSSNTSLPDNADDASSATQSSCIPGTTSRIKASKNKRRARIESALSDDDVTNGAHDTLMAENTGAKGKISNGQIRRNFNRGAEKAKRLKAHPGNGALLSTAQKALATLCAAPVEEDAISNSQTKEFEDLTAKTAVQRTSNSESDGMSDKSAKSTPILRQGSATLDGSPRTSIGPQKIHAGLQSNALASSMPFPPMFGSMIPPPPPLPFMPPWMMPPPMMPMMLHAMSQAYSQSSGYMAAGGAGVFGNGSGGSQPNGAPTEASTSSTRGVQGHVGSPWKPPSWPGQNDAGHTQLPLTMGYPTSSPGFSPAGQYVEPLFSAPNGNGMSAAFARRPPVGFSGDEMAIRHLLESFDITMLKPWVVSHFCEDVYLMLLDVWRADSPRIKDALWAYRMHVQRTQRPDYTAFLVSIFGLEKLLDLSKRAHMSLCKKPEKGCA